MAKPALPPNEKTGHPKSAPLPLRGAHRHGDAGGMERRASDTSQYKDESEHAGGWRQSDK